MAIWNADWNVTAQALRWATDELAAHSVIACGESKENRRAILQNEAELLLQWCSGWSRTQMLTALASSGRAPASSKGLDERDNAGGLFREGASGESPPGEAENRFKNAVRQRCQGVPLQYITGEAPFFGMMFHVSPSCLIPRPETELLAEAALNWLAKTFRSASDAATSPCLVDLGTGSGILAVTLALAFPEASVQALDISGDALAVAEKNARRLGARVQFWQADGIRWLERKQGALNLLISNPPYIPTADVANLEPEVKNHEPLLALDGGADGLDFYRNIAALGDSLFSHGPAALFLEVGNEQSESVIRRFRSARVWDNWAFASLRDLRGIPRVVMGERKVT